MLLHIDFTEMNHSSLPDTQRLGICPTLVGNFIDLVLEIFDGPSRPKYPFFQTDKKNHSLSKTIVSVA